MDSTQIDLLVNTWTRLVLRRFAGRQEIPVAELRQQIDALLDTCEAYLDPRDIAQLRARVATLLDAEIGGNNGCYETVH